MRNKIFLCVVIFPVLLGCGAVDKARRASTESNSNLAVNANANKSFAEKAIETAAGEQKVGIAECDEVLDILVAQAEDPNDNFVTKAVKKTALTTFRDQLKKKLDEHKTDKKEVAKFCKSFRDNLDETTKGASSNSGR